MVVKKIRSSRDLRNIDHYAKFSEPTKEQIRTALAYMKDVVERYNGILPASVLNEARRFQVDRIRPLIKADLERHARNAEKTAEFEENEEKKLYLIGSALLIASGLFFMATNFNPSVAIGGILVSGIFYLEGFLCGGRALAKKDEAQLLREFDIEAE